MSKEMRKYIDMFNEFNKKGLNEQKENDILKIDRKNILDYIGHDDWNIVLRKLNNIRFSNFRYKFEDALRNIKVSKKFIEKYKDLKIFPSVISNILKNKNYSENELLEIIEYRFVFG